MGHDIRDALWKLPACLGAVLLLGIVIVLAPYLLALLLGVAFAKVAVRGIRRLVLTPSYRICLWTVSKLGICPIGDDSLLCGSKGGDHASFDPRPELQADGCHCSAR